MWRARHSAARFCVGALVAAAITAGGWQGMKLAGKPQPSTPLQQTSEYWSFNPNGPGTACLMEDDWHSRTWTGSLSGTFTSTETLCDGYLYNGMYLESGGEGIAARVSGAGTLTDLTITTPTGVTQHAVLTSTTTSGKGKGGAQINTYMVCIMPSVTLDSDVGGMPLSMRYSGNPWTITLSGSMSNVTFNEQATMSYVDSQKRVCPPSQQNLVPLSTPTNLSASPASTSSIALTWTAYCGQSTAYNYTIGCSVFRDGVNVGSVGTRCSSYCPWTTWTYTDTGLAPGTTHTYQVQTVDSFGDVSQLSNPATATTPS